MDKKSLDERLEDLGKRIAAVKEHREFETNYNDGHKRTLQEVERHQKELHDKVKKDIHDHEETHGHINALEKQMIIFGESL